MQVKKQQLEQTWNNRLVQNWERSLLRLYIFTLLIQLLCRVHHVKHQAGWIRRWNEDCQEKYQNPQIHRWYHSNGRKQRWTKEHFMRVKVKILVTQLCLTLCNPMDCSLPVSSVHEFYRQEYWRGQPFLSPGALPMPGIRPRSTVLQADSLPPEPSKRRVKKLI